MRRESHDNQTVVQKNDRLFLYVNGDWIYYDMNERPLGEGAMGVVYLGRSSRTNEKFAVKRVVDYYAGNPSIRERARQEASMLFRHRNLVEMVGYCEVNPYSGPIFIISRLVQGVTIDRYVDTFLRKRPDAMQRISKLMFPVFSALEYLHSNNIVHMDIKPSNIMVENGSNVRLMDLGIATTDSAMELIGTGVIGTPRYAAPEQIHDDKQRFPINATTDIYELGVTLYELLAGFNPFDSNTRDETLARQKSMILPESSRITKPVLKVLRKATAKVQSDRFQTVREFRFALNEALNEKTVNPMIKVLAGIGIGLLAVMLIGIMFL